MKNVLLLVHDDEGQEARLQVALDLVRALDGHLTCLDVSVPQVIASDYTGMGQAMLMQIEREREGANKAKLESRLAQEDVAWNWLDVTETICDAVLDASMLADLIVLNPRVEDVPGMQSIVSRIVMHARKPIVAVPADVARLNLDRALIAWDGQASSAATMRACVPLLSKAKEVEIFMVRDGAENTEPDEAAEYLSRHGIHAEVRVVVDGLSDPHLLIENECKRWGADYVVMGAYGRGRLMEAFGGVTRRMLADGAIPLILGH